MVYYSVVFFSWQQRDLFDFQLFKWFYFVRLTFTLICISRPQSSIATTAISSPSKLDTHQSGTQWQGTKKLKAIRELRWNSQRLFLIASETLN